MVTILQVETKILIYIKYYFSKKYTQLVTIVRNINEFEIQYIILLLT